MSVAPFPPETEFGVVTHEELKQAMAGQACAIVDVREANEYDAGHIPGAIFLPLSAFDPAALPHPGDFDPTRGLGNQFLFGYGLHECLGRAIAAVMIPAIESEGLLQRGEMSLTAYAQHLDGAFSDNQIREILVARL